MQNNTTQVSATIERNIKFGRKLFATSFNPKTGEVMVKVDGLKFMEQPEERQHKATSLYYYWEALVDLYDFLYARFGNAINLAPVVREVKALQMRLDARGAQLTAKQEV